MSTILTRACYHIGYFFCTLLGYPVFFPWLFNQIPFTQTIPITIYSTIKSGTGHIRLPISFDDFFSTKFL